MLSVAQEYLAKLSSGAYLEAYGQELNDEPYAICKAHVLLQQLASCRSSADGSTTRRVGSPNERHAVAMDDTWGWSNDIRGP